MNLFNGSYPDSVYTELNSISSKLIRTKIEMKYLLLTKINKESQQLHSDHCGDVPNDILIISAQFTPIARSL